MALFEHGDVKIEVDEDGFIEEPDQWDEKVAAALASTEGVEELTENHWKVIEFCRESATENGSAPTLRQITTGTGITTKELFALYPKGPAKKVARISGLGKPEGCV